MNLPLRAPPPLPISELHTVRELARLPFHWRRLRAGPRGTAKVLVAPGFLTSDRVTWALRRALSARGHRVSGWGLGRNHGRVPELLAALTERVRKLGEREPVHLVGWSLGGYIAREVARDAPEAVAQVITLASPVVGGPKYTAAAGFFRRSGTDLDAIERRIAERERVPLRVPVTALYSHNDAVVSPAACIDRVNPGVAHIEVSCTHAGFVVSPRVMSIVASRLAKRRP